MAGIGGLVQAHYAQEVVPNALYGRELDVLAAVVLGGARLGGGKGSVLGCVLGVLLISITQNGLNLMGVSPFAFKMIIGAIILVAITLSNTRIEKLLPLLRRGGTGTMTVLVESFQKRFGSEMAGPFFAFIAVMIFFGVASPQFRARRPSVPSPSTAELGLLTLAMLLPILTGGLNLAINVHRKYRRIDGCLGAASEWRCGCRTPGVRPRVCAGAGGRSGKRRGDGFGHRAIRAPTHSRIAVDDDLPARPWRIPHQGR